ncbi:MAG: hydrogen peroxide-dependent heme synthase [Bryobacteraceae bacterium]
MAELPPAPLTLEGATVLHQMFRVRRAALRAAPVSTRRRAIDEAARVLGEMEQRAADGHPAQTAVYSQIGHKGDLLLLHFRESMEAAHRAELAVAQLELSDYLEATHSYLSMVELGLYESSAKAYGQLAEKGHEPHSAEWQAGIDEVTRRQAAAMTPRLWPEIPQSRYLCFYPMDRKRGEAKNWYLESMAERQRLMQEHSAIGRRYAGCVRQIITGSIGFDDWEWGVDLFADDPLVFKKLIYEMRFDEASAIYALFGMFYVGLRVAAAQIGNLLLSGELQTEPRA